MFEKIGDFLLSYTAKQLLKKAKEDWEVFGNPKQEEIEKAIEILKKDIKVYEKLENEESQTLYRFETLESYFLLTSLYEKLSLFDDDILDETEVSQKSAIQEVEARLDLLQEPKQMAKVHEYLTRYYSSIDIEKTERYNTLALENIEFVKTKQQKALIYHRQAMSYYQNSDMKNAKTNNDLALKYDNGLKMAKILDVKLALDEPSFDIQTIQTKLNNLKIQLQTDKNLLADVHIIEANMNLKLNKEQEGIKAYEEAYKTIENKDGLEVKKAFILYTLSILKDDEGMGTQAIILDIQSKNYRYDVKYYTEIARLMNEKSDDLNMNREYDKVIIYRQEALKILLKIYGENNHHVSSSYRNIGLAWNNKYEYDKALECYLKSLEIRLKIYGENHHYVASAYDIIGTHYYHKAIRDDALYYYQKSLEIRLKVHGVEHPNTVGSYNNIGSAYAHMGDYPKALKYSQKAYDILSLFASNHPDLIIVKENLEIIKSKLQH